MGKRTENMGGALSRWGRALSLFTQSFYHLAPHTLLQHPLLGPGSQECGPCTAKHVTAAKKKSLREFNKLFRRETMTALRV